MGRYPSCYHWTTHLIFSYLLLLNRNCTNIFRNFSHHIVVSSLSPIYELLRIAPRNSSIELQAFSPTVRSRFETTSSYHSRIVSRVIVTIFMSSIMRGHNTSDRINLRWNRRNNARVNYDRWNKFAPPWRTTRRILLSRTDNCYIHGTRGVPRALILPTLISR